MRRGKWEPVMEVNLWWGTKREALDLIENWVTRGQRQKQVATVNPEFVMQAVGDDRFFKTLEQTDLKVVDGVGLVWARRIKRSGEVGVGRNVIRGVMEAGNIIWGRKKVGLIPGVELAEGLIAKSSKRKWRVMLVGGWDGRAKRAAEKFQKKYKSLRIKAIEGEPKMSHKETIRHINEYKPDILFVAYGMRKQEEWIEANKNKLDFGVAVGVGRSFDYWSGELRRAPEWVRRMGLEWLYSLYQEPRRWRRQLALVRFVARVICR